MVAFILQQDTNMYIILGNANAENDQLLYDCKINRTDISENCQILVGKWGVGKTAILLLQNEIQLKLIEDKHGIDDSRMWYLSEDSLSLTALTELKEKYGTNTQYLIRAIENVWKAEIIRVYCYLLYLLKDNFENNNGTHWQVISKIAENKGIKTPIWDRVSDIIKVLSFNGSNSDPFIKEITSDNIYDNLLKCLRDIRDSEILPCVAVEPIETPHSAIEKDFSLAQSVVIALLNTYKSNFQPGRRDNYKMNVKISIPWHRYTIKDGADFPQKISQYISVVRWKRNELLEFINKRIEFEFSRVGRRRTNKDAWSSIIPEKLENKICDPPVMENSFDYFLRHTHYRPRDLQTLVRRCIEEQAVILKISETDVLKYHNLDEIVIKDAFRKHCKSLAIELIEEGNRRNNKLFDIVSVLRGMRIPFSIDELSKRIRTLEMDFNNTIELLWDIGIIGVIAIPKHKQSKVSTLLESIFTRENQKLFTKRFNTEERWVWFQYNYEGQINDLRDKLNLINDIDTMLIIHPKMFEHLLITINDKDAPVGI